MDYPYTTTMPIARRLADIIHPACHQIHIAGSLRRRKPTVHDIEIVCQPRVEHVTDLFGHAIDDYTPALDAILDQLIEAGELTPIKNGERFKQYIVNPSGIHFDLFIILPPAQYGAILAIRTGPAHYSQWLVTSRQKGGAKPSHLDQRDGALWEGDRLLLAPTEEAYFALLGISPVPDPPDRQPTWHRSPAAPQSPGPTLQTRED